MVGICGRGRIDMLKTYRGDFVTFIEENAWGSPEERNKLAETLSAIAFAYAEHAPRCTEEHCVKNGECAWRRAMSRVVDSLGTHSGVRISLVEGKVIIVSNHWVMTVPEDVP